MPFTYAGFDGKMREDTWRRTSEHLGCRYDVPGFVPSKLSGVDRTVRLGIGDAAGYGITVTNDAVVDKQLDPLAGATVRWDTIVLRINWT